MKGRRDRQTDRQKQWQGGPVVEQYVWSPDLGRRQANAGDSSVLALVPTQLVVGPFLQPSA